MFYKPSSASGYAVVGNVTGFQAWDGHTSVTVFPYKALNWILIPAANRLPSTHKPLFLLTRSGGATTPIRTTTEDFRGGFIRAGIST